MSGINLHLENREENLDDNKQHLTPGTMSYHKQYSSNQISLQLHLSGNLRPDSISGCISDFDT